MRNAVCGAPLGFIVSTPRVRRGPSTVIHSPPWLASPQRLPSSSTSQTRSGGAVQAAPAVRSQLIAKTSSMNEEQNPIVAMAQKIRARRDLGAAIESATGNIAVPRGDDAASRFAALSDVLATGVKRLNSILGSRTGVTIVRLENPPRPP